MTSPVSKVLALDCTPTHGFEDTVSVIFLKMFGEEVWILFGLKRTKLHQIRRPCLHTFWKVNNNGVCKKQKDLCFVLVRNLIEVEKYGFLLGMYLILLIFSEKLWLYKHIWFDCSRLQGSMRQEPIMAPLPSVTGFFKHLSASQANSCPTYSSVMNEESHRPRRVIELFIG